MLSSASVAALFGVFSASSDRPQPAELVAARRGSGVIHLACYPTGAKATDTHSHFNHWRHSSFTAHERERTASQHHPSPAL
jgi:hypothetical protein